MFILRLCRRVLSNQKGVSAIEFALVLPVVLLMISGIIDLMIVMFVTSLMEGGLRDASRLGRTGFAPVNISREQAITQAVADATIGFLDMGKIQISTLVYPSFTNIQQPEPFEDSDPPNGAYDIGEPYSDVNGNGQWDADMGVSGLGGPGEVILYRISYEWSLLTPLVANVVGTNGKLPLSVSVAVRNEPWVDPAG